MKRQEHKEHKEHKKEQEDYYQSLNTLDLMAQSYESDGTPAGRNYILYAYCLMSNHIHLLIREREDTIRMAIKRIASSYVYYYNHKYSRDGHLFRERYKSEPVNDMAYFRPGGSRWFPVHDDNLIFWA